MVKSKTCAYGVAMPGLICSILLSINILFRLLDVKLFNNDKYFHLLNLNEKKSFSFSDFI